MTCRIHVCDDEPHIVLAVSLKFRKAGFEVSSASDGQAAWDVIQEVRPQVVISDLQMPKMDGLDLVRRLRAESAFDNVPVILLTAKGFELDEADLREELGIQAVICKPFSPRELLALVQSLLGVTATVSE
jgi:DNA-binding response OmpR family regulator